MWSRVDLNCFCSLFLLLNFWLGHIFDYCRTFEVKCPLCATFTWQKDFGSASVCPPTWNAPIINYLIVPFIILPLLHSSSMLPECTGTNPISSTAVPECPTSPRCSMQQGRPPLKRGSATCNSNNSMWSCNSWWSWRSSTWATWTWLIPRSLTCSQYLNLAVRGAMAYLPAAHPSPQEQVTLQDSLNLNLGVSGGAPPWFKISWGEGEREGKSLSRY